MHIEMKRGEVIQNSQQHPKNAGHAVIGVVLGAIIVGVLWSLA